MKKVFASLALVLMVVLSCAVFVGCANQGVEGTYNFYSVTFGNETYEVGDEFDMEIIPEDYYTITLNKDGTFTERINSHGVDESTGHWVKEGDIYKLNYDENYTFEATIENGQMTFNSYGKILVLKK